MNGEVEQVLGVATAHLDRLFDFHGFLAISTDQLSELLASSQLQFRPRQEAELDPSFKQLIPYVVLCWQDQVFYYTRQGGAEKRLQSLKSIGIGGHINPVDADGPNVYWTGLWRELREEVELLASGEEQFLGLIRDERTPVGAVHLGVVHQLTLAAPAVRPRESGLAEVGFATITDLLAQREQFETWSQFVLDELAKRHSLRL